MAKQHKTETKSFVLPSYKHLPEADQCVVQIELPMRMDEFENVDDGLSQVLQTASLIIKKLKGWNLTDDEDKPIPVTIEEIAKLDAIDFTFLSVTLGLGEMMKLANQKKTV